MSRFPRDYHFNEKLEIIWIFLKCCVYTANDVYLSSHFGFHQHIFCTKIQIMAEMRVSWKGVIFYRWHLWSLGTFSIYTANDVYLSSHFGFHRHIFCMKIQILAEMLVCWKAVIFYRRHLWSLGTFSIGCTSIHLYFFG